MADILTAGTRITFSPDGRRIHQIPLSTTDNSNAAAPSAPSGTRLVAYEYTQRPDGGRDYNFTYESITPTSGDKQQQINGQAAQEPIETHPKFNGQQGGGIVIEADLAAIKASLSSGTAPTFTSTGEALTAAQDLYRLMLKGVTHYFTPSGITYSETTDETIKPNVKEIATVDRPPNDAPSVGPNANWLLIGLRAQKIFDPVTGNSFWRTTREWLASGPRGWNADFEIY